uniref:Uncharacterized protein n=1 Tax=Serratia phage Kevin TaxID=3161161 RepID=A0AAU8KYV2_9CAUD
MSKINHAHASFFDALGPAIAFQFTREEHEEACEANLELDRHIDVLLAETKGDLTLYLSSTVNRMWLFEGDDVVMHIDEFQWDEGGAEYKDTLITNAFSNGFTKYIWN